MEKLIRQLEAVYDHSKLDSMLKLKGYDGKAYLFMLDNDGNITYTNQSGDKYLRNYSLLKHLKGATGYYRRRG